MRTIRVMFVRTFVRLWVSWTALAGAVAFLALSGAGFVRALMRGDGGSVPVAALWAVAAVPFLPVMAETLGIDKVYGICLMENAASRHVLEKCGFETVSEGTGDYQGEQREVYKSVWRKA